MSGKDTSFCLGNERRRLGPLLTYKFSKNISCIVINKVARYFHENRLTVQGFTRQELSLVLARSDFYITTDDTFCS